MGGALTRAWAVLRSPRAALIAFIVFLVVSVPAAVHLGGFRWFFLDDWDFLTARQLDSVDGVFRAYNSHWVSIPIVLYRLLYGAFGIRTYLPYQLLAIASHLGVVVLVRMLLRRSGVSPWLATGTASVLVLFGPGAENIVSAFQVQFTASLAFALAQLLVADHPGRDRRRDAWALLLGLCAIMSSGVGLPVVVATGAALLVRHGWRRAAVQTVPLGVIYLLWLPLFRDPNTPDVPVPGVRTVLSWVWNAITGSFAELGQHTVVALLLVAILVVGMAVAMWAPTGTVDEDGEAGAGTDRSFRVRVGGWIARHVAPVAVPLALLAAALLFSALTALGRWIFGIESARTSRYLYVYVALMLPAFGVAAQALVSRTRVMGPVVGLLLVGIITVNVSTGSFDSSSGSSFNEAAFRRQEDLFTTVARMPEAREVPPDVRPYPIFVGPISPAAGFLVQALEDGKLDASTRPITPAEAGEFRVRLGLAQRDEEPRAGECTLPVVPEPTIYPKGTRFWATAPILARLSDEEGNPVGQAVSFQPSAGHSLTVELPDLPLRLTIAGDGRFRRCEDG